MSEPARRFLLLEKNASRSTSSAVAEFAGERMALIATMLLMAVSRPR